MTKAIQIVTCEGLQDSTLDETYINVFKPHVETPYIQRIYKATPARLARVRALHHAGTLESRMIVCNWRYENYTNNPCQQDK